MAAETNRGTGFAKRLLGVEGGGTKTEWLLTGAGPGEVSQGLLPASNLKLSTDEHLAALLSVLPSEVEAIGLFLAGCATDADRLRLRRLVEARWPGTPVTVGSDRDSAFATAFAEGDGIVVIAGTGAAVHGRRGKQVERAGGWGQLLGDRGSGYHLTMQALRQVLSRYDLTGEVSPLARTILRMLALNGLRDLVDWVSQAEKMAVARLAPAVFEAAREGDREMQTVIEEGARILAEFTGALAHRLHAPELRVKVFGGLFAHHPEYTESFARHLKPILPRASVELCMASGAIGAAWLAAEALGDPVAGDLAVPVRTTGVPADRGDLARATTEQANPRSAKLESLSTAGLVALFIAEERTVEEALHAQAAAITAAVDLVAERLRRGGRLFYVGAGTSGRLGVLDASEIPPTFGASPELVQGIMAGGAAALHRAVEGAEDQPQAGALALHERGVRSNDAVVGLTASGRTPFVQGALTEARRLGAGTVLVTCNPARPPGPGWDVEIDLPTGAELVTGSTRLKAGTATKLVLNILSTCTMVRLGKVRGNAMVEVQITNEKLRDRGARVVAAALEISYEEALRRLEAKDWNVRACLPK